VSRSPALAGAALWVTVLLAGCAGPPCGEVCTVKRADLVLTVEAAGSLKAEDNATVGPPIVPQVWNLKIVWIAPEGRAVRAGEPILAFDDSELRQDLERKKADRDQASKEMEKEELDLRVQLLDLEAQRAEAESRLRRVRPKLDVPEDLVAPAERAKDRLDHDLAAAEVESLGLQRRLLEESGQTQIEILRQRRDRSAERVGELEKGISEMQVRAPRGGIVVYVTGWREEKHKAGDSVYRMEKILEIPDLRSMGAEAEIDEEDAGRIRVGQPVRLRLEAYPDRQFRGRVAEIAPAIRHSSRNSAVRTRVARVRLEGDKPEWMRPGMRFRGEIEVERVDHALVIPLEAVTPGAGGPVVTRITSLGRTERPVKLGRRNQTLVEVVSGLEEGDRISNVPSVEDGTEPRRGVS